MFRVSWLGIWWRHGIWISKKLKFDYLKNEKSFRSEIKKHYCLAHKCSLIDIQKTGKNVADTTFKEKQKKTLKIKTSLRIAIGKISNVSTLKNATFNLASIYIFPTHGLNTGTLPEVSFRPYQISMMKQFCGN